MTSINDTQDTASDTVPTLNDAVVEPPFQMILPPVLPGIHMERPLVNFSATRGELIAALARAQAQFTEIPKNRTGEVRGKNSSGQPYQYEYKYADISDVLAIVRPITGAEGIAIIQTPEIATESHLELTSYLMFGEEWMRSVLRMRLGDPGRQSPSQVLGGQITYLRRYALCAIVGVQAEEDRDEQTGGSSDKSPRKNAASKAKKPATRRKAEESLSAPARLSVVEGCLDEAQQRFVIDGLKILNEPVGDLLDAICEGTEYSAAEIKMPKNIPSELYEACQTYINNKVSG